MHCKLGEDDSTSNADNIDPKSDKDEEKDVLNVIYPRLVKRVLYAGIYTPRNIFIWSLNGSPEDIQRGYQNLYNHIHCYLRTRGKSVDVSNLFGRNKEVYTTPEKGTFRIIVQYGSASIGFFVEARYWWLRGLENKHGKFELPEMKTGLYMDHLDCKKLRFKGNYYDLCNGKPGRVLIGLPRIIKGFLAVESYKDSMKEPEDFRFFLSLFTLLFCEAPRLLPVYNILSRSIVDPNICRMENEFPWIDFLIKNWRSSCTFIMAYLQDLYEGRTPKIPASEIPGMNSIQGMLRMYTILQLDAYEEGDLFQHGPVKYPAEWQQIDKGYGYFSTVEIPDSMLINMFIGQIDKQNHRQSQANLLINSGFYNTFPRRYATSVQRSLIIIEKGYTDMGTTGVYAELMDHAPPHCLSLEINMNVQRIDLSASQRNYEANSHWAQSSLKNQVNGGPLLCGKSSPPLGCFGTLLQGNLIAPYNKDGGSIRGKKAHQQQRRNIEYNQNTNNHIMGGFMQAEMTSYVGRNQGQDHQNLLSYKKGLSICGLKINTSIQYTFCRTLKLPATFDWTKYFPKTQVKRELTQGSVASSPLMCFGLLVQRNSDAEFSKHSGCSEGRTLPPLLNCFRFFVQQKRIKITPIVSASYSMTQGGLPRTIYGACLQRKEILECNLFSKSFEESQQLQGRQATFSARKLIAGNIFGHRHRVTIKVKHLTIRL